MSDLLKQDKEKEGLIFVNEQEIEFIDGKTNVVTRARAFADSVLDTVKLPLKNGNTATAPRKKIMSNL